VLDATRGDPVADALVTLEALPAGALVDGRTATVVGVRSTLTGANGSYLFSDLSAGSYRLRVERLGYRSAVVTVEVRRPAAVRVSLGLELEPVALEPLSVVGQATPLFERGSNEPVESEEARVMAERARQQLFLTPDSRMLTAADVMDGVTLGEGDVFRALQRFPGVGTRDDYSAELWTRGAPWTHTRVTFDGVPLFNPVHAVGLLSAVAPEILGAVFFHPGVLPASTGEGAAAVVDLRSRPAGGEGGVRGVADLSMASAKLALDQRVGDRAAWVLSARRSHLDVLSGGVGWLGLDTLDLPYVFHDLAGRGDIRLGERAALEGSALWEEDRVFGDVQGVLERTEAKWGNAAARLTLHTPVSGLALSHTIGASRFQARTDERLVRTRAPAPTWTEEASRNEIRHVQLSGDLLPEPDAGVARWGIGYFASFEDITYAGPWPRYHPVKPDTVRRLSYEREQWAGGVWGEGRVDVSARVTVSPALRLGWVGSKAVRVRAQASPKISLRYAFSEDHLLSVALGRTWQTMQAVALAGPSIHPAFHASHFWVLADDRVPAIRSDLASIGSEHWLGRGWLASATLFLRHATGVAVADPTPGPLLDRSRSFVSIGETTARGAELGVRRIGARWSVSAGYTYGRSETEVERWRYPGGADRRHTVDAMFGVRVSDDVRVSAAFTGMSGAPFTRAVSRFSGDCELFGFGCGNSSAIVFAPNAERTPAYRSLDASIHWGHVYGPVRVGAYLQVRNVLGRDNASTYSGSVPKGTDVFEDRFEAGLRRVPLVGVRATF
jgi:hypothetical protein